MLVLLFAAGTGTAAFAGALQATLGHAHGLLGHAVCLLLESITRFADGQLGLHDGGRLVERWHTAEIGGGTGCHGARGDGVQFVHVAAKRAPLRAWPSVVGVTG
ncbi:hypothetical protein LP420_18645 [Massilia sp. B-10]|nr:hypothetical protein LP420_18645 [Massilia sp. B-10]